MASGRRKHHSNDTDETLSRLLAKVLDHEIQSLDTDDNETLSRLLAKVLRHDAPTLGLPIQSGGFIFVNDLLQSSKFSGYSESDIRRVVDVYDNKRFALETDPRTQKLKIKANQAHTFNVPDLDLQPIRNASEIPVLIHLTTEAAWRSIQVEGLRRMNRMHIHFSPGEENIVRSKISSCKVHIYLDTASAMAGGIKFFRSENNVVLSPGNADGAIPRRFFSQVKLHEGSRRTTLM